MSDEKKKQRRRSKAFCATRFALHDTRGFTLIETLVAIMILTVSIAGPLTIATKGLSSAIFARDQITAFYLAQEAVEFVRNTRDQNSLHVPPVPPWLTGLGDCFADACKIDVKNTTISSCGGSCPPLLHDETTDFYNYEIGEPSPFTRTVSLVTVDADEVAVNVTLSWRTGVFVRTFTVKEHMRNWQQ